MKDERQNLSDVTSEAGVIATLIHHPDYIFYSEDLTPNHFSNEDNAQYFDAISYLARQDVGRIDAYNITAAMSTLGIGNIPSAREINEYIELCDCIARQSPEEYKVLVNNVRDRAFRRDLLGKLRQCERICESGKNEDIRNKVYDALDGVMMNYSTVTEIPPFSSVVDDMWERIVKKQNPEVSGISWKFPALDHYCTIDKGEMVVVGGQAKRGKSMFLMNCAVDLIRKGKSVLYVDSELSTEAFTLRLLSYLTHIEHGRIKRGNYTEEEESRIKTALTDIKHWNFTHIYMPRFDDKAIFIMSKKLKHTRGLDILVLDYLKTKKDNTDAYAVYAEAGKTADLLKNQIAGDLDIAVLTAVQLTDTNKVADSANIGRSASTLILILDKTFDEMAEDGDRCGNKKLFVSMNRNGEQMREGEYIDMNFDGNFCSFTQAQQHTPEIPV